MKYIIVPNANAEEEDQLGYYGVQLLNAIRTKPRLYQQMKENNTLIEEIRLAEELFDSQMTSMIHSGIDQLTALEIVWLEITAIFGLNHDPEE